VKLFKTVNIMDHKTTANIDHVTSGKTNDNTSSNYKTENNIGRSSIQNGHSNYLHYGARMLETNKLTSTYTQNGDVTSNGVNGVHESLMTQEQLDENNDVIFVRRGAISCENIHKIVKAKDNTGFCEKITKIKRKIEQDKLYRHKFWYSVSLIASFFVLVSTYSVLVSIYSVLVSIYCFSEYIFCFSEYIFCFSEYIFRFTLNVYF